MHFDRFWFRLLRAQRQALQAAFRFLVELFDFFLPLRPLLLQLARLFSELSDCFFVQLVQLFEERRFLRLEDCDTRGD